MDTHRFGNLGERYAATLLQSKGYTIHARNFKTKVGEIDLVAQDGSTLVFVEVKTRQNIEFGKPEEAVNARKLFRIKRAGEYYSILHPELPKKLRIDVVALQTEGGKVTSAKILKVY